MRLFILIILQFITGLICNAQQSYESAVGLRLFSGGGITYKQFIKAGKAIEGVAFFYNKGARISATLQVHKPLADIEHLQWYYGFGGHISFYNDNFGGNSAIGVDGVLGLDYKVDQLPINISLDWQPSFEIGGKKVLYGWGGLSLRYVIK